MAANYGPFSVVLKADIDEASRKIAASSDTDDVVAGQLGSAFNQWQRPVTDFGRSDPEWVVKLKASRYVGEIDFGRKEWARARDAVDSVMELLLKDMRAKAQKYEGLRIDSYIRQGSSRDGLKVIKPDEFDTHIEFHIEGLAVQEKTIDRNGNAIPGFCYLQVQHTPDILQKRYPKLWQENVFLFDDDGNMCLSSRKLHEGVFKSIIDQSSLAIKEKVRGMKQSQPVNFHITRRMNPPAVNIRIHLDDDVNEMFMIKGQMRNRSEGIRVIDLDIVPALRLRVDQETRHKTGNYVNAVIHAICKWKEEEATRALEFVDQNLVWLINSAGYERYTLDVARKNKEQTYILTALRILKTYFTKTNIVAKQENRPPPPIVAILSSYHLKMVTFYLILYTSYVYPHVQIDGAQQALAYLLALLEITIEKKHLPHFFYSNSQIRSMYPNFPLVPGALRFDLFRKLPPESLRQAHFSYENHLLEDLGFSGSSDGEEDTHLSKLVSTFRSLIDEDDYF